MAEHLEALMARIDDIDFEARAIAKDVHNMAADPVANGTEHAKTLARTTAALPHLCHALIMNHIQADEIEALKQELTAEAKKMPAA